MKNNTPLPTSGGGEKTSQNTPHVRVPLAALDICQDITDKGAVLDLYEWADSARYKPLKMTARSLQARWGMSWRRCEDLISALIEEGLMVLHRAGTNRRGRYLRVLRASEIDSDLGRSLGRRVGRSTEPVTETSDDLGTQLGTQLGTPTHARVSDSRLQTTEENNSIEASEGEHCPAWAEAPYKSVDNSSDADGTETIASQKPLIKANRTDGSGNTAKQAKAAALAELWQSMETIRSHAKRGPDKPVRVRKLGSGRGSKRASLTARLRDYSPAEVLTVCRWLWTSQHKRAVFLRDNGQEGAILTGKMGDYLDMATDEAEAATSSKAPPWVRPANPPTPALIDCPDAAAIFARSIRRDLARIRAAGGKAPEIRSYLQWRCSDADAVMAAIGGAS